MSGVVMRSLGWKAASLYDRQVLLVAIEAILKRARDERPADGDPTERTLLVLDLTTVREERERTERLIEAWERAREYAGMASAAAAAS